MCRHWSDPKPNFAPGDVYKPGAMSGQWKGRIYVRIVLFYSYLVLFRELYSNRLSLDNRSQQEKRSIICCTRLNTRAPETNAGSSPKRGFTSSCSPFTSNWKNTTVSAVAFPLTTPAPRKRNQQLHAASYPSHPQSCKNSACTQPRSTNQISKQRQHKMPRPLLRRWLRWRLFRRARW